jgi:hypothetical protein
MPNAKENQTDNLDENTAIDNNNSLGLRSDNHVAGGE